MPNDSDLLIEANVIKNETGAAQNTAVRVGTLFVDIVGSKLSSLLSIVASENIPAYSVVTVDGYVGDSGSVNQRNRLIGITASAISNGFSGDVTVNGKITNAAWSWVKGDKIFLNGTSLSTSAPSVGFVQLIGVAYSSDTIDIQIKQGILL